MITYLQRFNIRWSTLLLVLILSPSHAENMIQGVLKNTEGSALEGAKVFVLHEEVEVITTSEGRFELSYEDNLELVCEKEGYLTTHYSIDPKRRSEIDITMIPSSGSVTDVDGNKYQTVLIGEQEWTTQNLRTTKLNDGTPILHVTEDEKWVSETPQYCYLHNNPDFAQRFGILYNWYVLETGKLAPEGWRVSTAEDWEQLEQYLISTHHNFDQSKKGNQLAKTLSSQTNDWPMDFPAGTSGNQFQLNNSSGFSAFPSGARGGAKGNFVHLNEDAYWWTATEKNGKAIRRNIFGSKTLLNLTTSNKSAGMSIRLVRDKKN